MSSTQTAQAWLEQFIRDNGGVAGTVHQRIDADNLALAAAVNIPPPVQEIVRRIPKGKGMAGLAFEHDEPISTCNIKDDNTGKVRPGAKAVQAQAAVAFPVHDDGGRRPRRRRHRLPGRPRAQPERARRPHALPQAGAARTA